MIPLRGVARAISRNFSGNAARIARARWGIPDTRGKNSRARVPCRHVRDASRQIARICSEIKVKPACVPREIRIVCILCMYFMYNSTRVLRCSLE
jgi:hypothetical protein